jgi:MraZ protein
MQRLLLSGTFDHTLDPKGRVTLPARYREHFQHGAVLVRFPGGEPCISVFHPDAWADFDAKHLEPLNEFENKREGWKARLIYKNQDLVEPDRQGRVLLPAHHVRDLGLSGKVTVIGSRTHLEIWDPATLATREQEMGSADA